MLLQLKDMEQSQPRSEERGVESQEVARAELEGVLSSLEDAWTATAPPGYEDLRTIHVEH